MPDPDKSPSDQLDQLFAAPDVAPVVRTNSLAVPVGDEGTPQPADGPKLKRMTFDQLLTRLTPVVWVTPTLLLANIAVYLMMVSQGVDYLLPTIVDLKKWGANYGPLTWNGQPWRLVTCMFLHGGAIHLAVNMWALWSAGRLLERLIGNVGFLIVYFSAGVAGSLASLWWRGDVTSVGASGAIFGLLGAFAAFIWNRNDTFPLSALSQMRSSLLTCIGCNLLFGAAIPGIDQAAHVGGLLCGLMLGCVLSQRLDQFTKQRRVGRNLISAVLSLLVLGILIARHTPPPPDISKEVESYNKVVPDTLKKFDTAAIAFNTGKIDSKRMTRVIKDDILPPWHELSVQIDALASLPSVRRDFVHRLQTHLKVREESWLLLLEALRKDNPDKLSEYKAKWKQADLLLQQILDAK